MLAGAAVVAKKKALRAGPSPVAAAEPAEVKAVHTRILRLALGVEEARAYWEQVDAALPGAERAKVAFEERWFGAKSRERVGYLIAAFALRYDAFPNALKVLRRWSAMDLATRKAICHWHLQLSDPIYRRFTGEYLVQRRALPAPRVDRDAVLRWVKSEFPASWSEATCVQFASKLLSAALQAGLVSKRDPRALVCPRVTDPALGYLLYLLRETRFAGTLTCNPYLASMGLDEDLLAHRARALPGVTMRRMMGLVEFDWAHPDLAACASELTASELAS